VLTVLLARAETKCAGSAVEAAVSVRHSYYVYVQSRVSAAAAAASAVQLAGRRTLAQLRLAVRDDGRRGGSQRRASRSRDASRGADADGRLARAASGVQRQRLCVARLLLSRLRCRRHRLHDVLVAAERTHLVAELKVPAARARRDRCGRHTRSVNTRALAQQTRGKKKKKKKPTTHNDSQARSHDDARGVYPPQVLAEAAVALLALEHDLMGVLARVSSDLVVAVDAVVELEAAREAHRHLGVEDVLALRSSHGTPPPSAPSHKRDKRNATAKPGRQQAPTI
jgi:hypothetical protein